MATVTPPTYNLQQQHDGEQTQRHGTPQIQITPASTNHPTSQYNRKPDCAMPSASFQLGAAPAGVYTYSVRLLDILVRVHEQLANKVQAPPLPHIYVPQKRDDKALVLTPVDTFHCRPEQREVLTHIIQHGCSRKPPGDWKYSSRRNAQAILPFLFLGPSSAARDIEALRASGITLLLFVRDASMVQSQFLSGEKVAAQLGIETVAVDVRGNTELIASLPRVIELINDHICNIFQHRVQSGMAAADLAAVGKVLICCESGNERSATVAAAYLMDMYNLDEIRALQYVQDRRFCVAYDDGLKHLLRAYSDLLQARNSLGGGDLEHGRIALSSRPKRGRDDMDDDMEVDTVQLDDVERFGRRAAFTPFRDVSQERSSSISSA